MATWFPTPGLSIPVGYMSMSRAPYPSDDSWISFFAGRELCGAAKGEGGWGDACHVWPTPPGFHISLQRNCKDDVS